MHLSEENGPRNFWNSGWPENLVSGLAFLGLLIAVFIGFDPNVRQDAGSDFKTLYASTWCYSHHLDGYQFPNLAAVFRANKVVEPQSWYGHAPVYPPFTLALLAPLTAMPMVPATYLWIIASGVLMAFATAALARSAGRVFGVPIFYRLLIVILIVCSPLVSLGLDLGNVSVAVVALCILALTSGSDSRSWLPAIGLSAALILKPHIACWTVLAMLLSRTSADRNLLKKAVLVTTSAIVLILAWMLSNHSFISQITSYSAVVRSELANGSMAPGNRDLMEIEVQITSFSHLLGYLLKPGFLSHAINLLVLCGLAVALIWSALRFSRVSPQPRYLIAPAVFAFGLLATYHREADSTLLLFLLPLLLSRLHTNVKDAWAWSAFALLVAGSFGPRVDMMRLLPDRDGLYSALRFLVLRQAAIVDLCLAVMLISALVTGAATQTRPERRTAPTT